MLRPCCHGAASAIRGITVPCLCWGCDSGTRVSTIWLLLCQHHGVLWGAAAGNANSDLGWASLSCLRELQGHCPSALAASLLAPGCSRGTAAPEACCQPGITCDPGISSQGTGKTPQLLVQAQQVPPSHSVHGATLPAPQSPQGSVLCSGPWGSAGVLSQGSCPQHHTLLVSPLGAAGDTRWLAPAMSAVCTGAAGGLGAALPRPHTTGIPDPPVSSALSTEPTRGKFYKLEETQVKAEGAQS